MVAAAVACVQRGNGMPWAAHLGVRHSSARSGERQDGMVTEATASASSSGR
jgi:hypothetical protein